MIVGQSKKLKKLKALPCGMGDFLFYHVLFMQRHFQTVHKYYNSDSKGEGSEISGN